jgi:hypothetical protein
MVSPGPTVPPARGDHAQQGGLAAAGRADQGDEFMVADLDIDTVYDGDRAEQLGARRIETDAIAPSLSCRRCRGRPIVAGRTADVRDR